MGGCGGVVWLRVVDRRWRGFVRGSFICSAWLEN